jgi:hypothetical protein
MAVTETGTRTQFTGAAATNTGTASTTITVPADATLVVVGVSTYSATANFISGGSLTFTKGGVDTAMVAVQPATRGDGSTAASMVAMFYMVLPDTGSNKTLKWDFSGTGTPLGPPLLAVTFWTGVNTSTPVRASGGGQSASGVPFTTSSIAALSGDLILAFAGSNNVVGTEGTVNSWSNVSLLAQCTTTGDAGGNGYDGAWATGSPSGTTTVAASTATNWQDGGIVAIALAPAAAAAASLLWTPSRSFQHMLIR